MTVDTTALDTAATMVQDEALAVAFERVRPRLVRVAYAVVGSHADAEDVAAACWLRLVTGHAREPVVDVGKCCTVAVARASIDLFALGAQTARNLRSASNQLSANHRPADEPLCSLVRTSRPKRDVARASRKQGRRYCGGSPSPLRSGCSHSEACTLWPRRSSPNQPNACVEVEHAFRPAVAGVVTRHE